MQISLQRKALGELLLQIIMCLSEEALGILCQLLPTLASALMCLFLPEAHLSLQSPCEVSTSVIIG